MRSNIAFAALAALFAAFTDAQIFPVNVTSNSAFRYINYTTVTGYFLQDLPTTNVSTFDYIATNFGLINQTYPQTSSQASNLSQWQQFALQVDYLNNVAPDNVVYKLIWFGRHGEGYHNAAQTYYGTPNWNCYTAEINGNTTASWDDAALDASGIAQALEANALWARLISQQHIPVPQSYYTSPLKRCLQTANLTFNGLNLPAYYPFAPTVRELLRESISIHTCDRRSNRTYISNTFPNYNIDPDFPECDPYWNGVTAETDEAQAARSRIVLDSIFTDDDHTFISVTSHSGEIASILSVLGHQPFSLSTGAVIPVLIKATFQSTGLPYSYPPYTTSTHCAAPPVTSIGSLDQGCVCSGTSVGGVTYRIDTISSDYPTGAGYKATSAICAATSSVSSARPTSLTASSPTTSSHAASTTSTSSHSGYHESTCATICSPTNWQTWGPGGWSGGWGAPHGW